MKKINTILYNLASKNLSGSTIVLPPKPKPPINAFYVENRSGVENKLRVTTVNTFFSPHLSLEYSFNGYDWVTWTNIYDTPIPFSKKVYIRGENERWGRLDSEITESGTTAISYFWNYIICDKDYAVGGDITTLLNKVGKLEDITDMRDVVDYDKGQKFFRLFSKDYNQNSTLVDAKDLILYPKIGSKNDFGEMFKGCNKLKRSPIIPQNEYKNSYAWYMFKNCRSLEEIEVDCTNWGTDNGYYTAGWVEGVSPKGKFIKPKALQIGNGVGKIPIGVDGIPEGWEIIEK